MPGPHKGHRFSRLTAAAAGTFLIAVLLVAVPPILPQAPFTVRADAAGCLDDSGNPVTCPVTVEPTPLPSGKTLGEQEIVTTFGGSGGTPFEQPYEWRLGSSVRACLPRLGACNLSKAARVGDPIPDRAVASDATGLSLNSQGDNAVASGDFNGDGRDETVTAAQCPGSTEICLSVYDPVTDSYGSASTPWTRTGLTSDSASSGRMRLASGLFLRTTVTITRATFELASDMQDENPSAKVAKGGVIATFTTSEPHGLIPGQPIRFGDDPNLAAAMCPALEAGSSVLCGKDLSADWMPIYRTTSTTFQVRLGFSADLPSPKDVSTDAALQVPGPWPTASDLGTLESDLSATETTACVVESTSPPAPPFDVFVDDEVMTVTKREQTSTPSAPCKDQTGGSSYTYALTRGADATTHAQGTNVSSVCGSCTIQAVGVRPGIVLTFDAPTRSARIAAFEVRPGKPRPFRKLDVAAVGRLAATATCGTGCSGSGREAVDVASGDFDGDGADEAAVVWAGTTGSGDRLGLVRFFSVSEAKQLDTLTNPVPWDGVYGQAPYDVSAATGFLDRTSGGNTAGEDLVIGWAGADHRFEVFDVSQSFRLRSVSLDDSLADRVKKKSGKVADWEKDTPYTTDDIVRDPLGFWTPDRNATSACSSAADSTSTFYLPNPAAGPAFRSPLPQLSAPRWSSAGAFTISPKALTPFPIGLGAVRGLLSTQPTPTTSAISMYGSSSSVLSGTSALQGQYVSPALKAQTIAASERLKLLLQTAAFGAGDTTSLYPDVIVRIVSGDGRTERGILYSSLGRGVSAASGLPYPTQTTWQNQADQNLNYWAGKTRMFPPSTALAPSPVPVERSIEVQQGDRLVVEFGTRFTATDSSPRGFGWIWVGGNAPLPDDQTTVGGAVTGPYAPYIKFTDPLQINTCQDHTADTSGIVWSKVTAGAAVSTAESRVPNENTKASIEVATGDFDMDGLDEVVTAQTSNQADAGADIPGANAPIDVQIWSPVEPTCSDPSSPAADQACPSRDGNPIKVPLQRFASYQKFGYANGQLGTGQLSLEVGRLGATGSDVPEEQKAEPDVPVTFPNDLNPDVVVSWVCDRGFTPTPATTTGCGPNPVAAPDGPSNGQAVALQAFDVCVRDGTNDGGADCVGDPRQSDRWVLTGQGSTMSHVRSNLGPADQWSATNFTLPDLDRDAKTLGSPLEYLETGRFQPLLIVRSPPVHFDAFDVHTVLPDPDDPDSTITVPGPDGRIDPTEVYDINNCFLTYLATGDEYVCKTESSYGTSVETTSTIQGQINQSNTIAGAIGAAGTIGAGNAVGACAQDGRDKEAAKPATPAESAVEPSACVEAQGFVNVALSESQTSSLTKEVGQQFTYASTVTTSAGSDAVYAAIQQNQVLEYPVYAGAGFGFGAGDPIEYVTSKTPLRTRFQWTSSNVYNIPVVSKGLSPQNVLSYASSEAQLERSTPGYRAVSAKRNEVGGLDVSMMDSPGIKCALDPNADALSGAKPVEIRGTDTWGDTKAISSNSFDSYPCSAGNVPVEIQDSGTPLDRSYVVTEVLSDRCGDLCAVMLRLQPTTPIPTGAWPSTFTVVPIRTKLFRGPGSFPVDEWTVQRFNKLEAEVSTSTESGFDSSFGWSFGRGLNAGAGFSAAFNGGLLGGFAYAGFSVAAQMSTDYNQEELNSMSIGTTTETRFTIKVTGDVRANVSYTIRPFLTTSPTGAMVLDWTTGIDSLQTFWNNNYRDPGPDPAFALPSLLTPYKAPEPNSKPAITTPMLLQSPDFAGWECRENQDEDNNNQIFYDQCRPRGEADPATPFFLTATVHNYSLLAYDRSTPLKVRFYIGDPARGGYMIKEADVPSVKSKECVNRFCLPSRGESMLSVPWNWYTEYPGIAGRGVPTDPLPIYAIVDPANKLVGEVHDFTAPVEVRDCAADYPTIANDWNSVCPTTNNEGWFLQQFGGSPVGSVDLNVARPGDVVFDPGNGQVTARVRSAAIAGAAPSSGPVDVSLYRCPASNPACMPQTTATKVGTTQQIVGGIAPGGSLPVTFNAGALASGTVLWVQAVARGAWERPGGGPFDRTGSLRNNVVRFVVP